MSGRENITTYWWNFGKKTKDFSGTYLDWLKHKNIHVEKISVTPKVHVAIYSFNVGRNRIQLTRILNDDLLEERAAVIDVIQIYMTLMGDKALLLAGKEYRINW